MALLLSGCTLLGELGDDQPLERLGFAADHVEVLDAFSTLEFDEPVTGLNDGVIDAPMGTISLTSATRSEVMTGYDVSNLRVGNSELDYEESVSAPAGEEFRAVTLTVEGGGWPQVGLTEGSDHRFWLGQVQRFSITAPTSAAGETLTQPVQWSTTMGSTLTVVLLVEQDAPPSAATFELEIDGKVQQLSLITGELLQDADGTIGAASAESLELREPQASEEKIERDEGSDIVTGDILAEYHVTTAPYSQVLGWPDDGATYVGVSLQVVQYYEPPSGFDITLPVREIEGTLTLDDGTEVQAVLIEPATTDPRGDSIYTAWFAVPSEFSGGELSFTVSEVFPRTEELNAQIDHVPFTARLEVIA
ncbi:hypothetical protein [Gulosibacter sp. ACHW.36C]|uniref:Bacterial spore germination immunoglobulin-like domain-containing protein n=1 Tax=Gulosibacter sediminis TaxID=1729695 RepID=A0ABY4MWT6_9MICO|nr:hypothetical protein [Gulosibacter sediminis]UQN14880.1 hypothetical protein M3M28_12690 [Gulosibacter sediminis]